MAELAPQEGSQVESPLVSYNTHERQYDFHWLNTALHLYGDEYDNYCAYMEDGKTHDMRLPEPIWDRLLVDGDRFPFSYFPTKAVERHWKTPQGLTDNYRIEQYEPMTVEYPGGEAYSLLWNNSCLRLFGEGQYNHLEVRVPRDDGGFEVRGMFITEDVWEHLFENDYPMIYLPTIEMDDTTKKWFEAHHSGRLDK